MKLKFEAAILFSILSLICVDLTAARNVQNISSGIVSEDRSDVVNSLSDGANLQNSSDSNQIRSNEPNASDVRFDPCAEKPCLNQGICSTRGRDYNCDCPIHYSGPQCQFRTSLYFSGEFKGDGYIELNRSSVVPSEREKDILFAILFSTTAPNSLLAWYGQLKNEAYNGQDFVAVGVVDGYVVLSYRLNGKETTVKNSFTTVDDGKLHIVVVHRTGYKATNKVDHYSVEGATEPTEEYSHLPGNLFIGGAPNMTTFTGNRFTQGYNGSIYIVQSSDSEAIDINKFAVSGYNVIPGETMII